jgi:hypothetical protein
MARSGLPIRDTLCRTDPGTTAPHGASGSGATEISREFPWLRFQEVRLWLELGPGLYRGFVGVVLVGCGSTLAVGVGAVRDGKDLDRASRVIDAIDDAVGPTAR